MKPLLLSDFDGVINAPINHLYWVDNFSNGKYPDPDLNHHEDRILDPAVHYDTDNEKYLPAGEYGVDKLRWSSELINKYRTLMKTEQVEFIWFTGWKQRAVDVLTPLFEFPNATRHIAPTKAGTTVTDIGHVWKIEAIIELYKTQPQGRPLIWLDDIVTEPFKNFPEKGNKHDWFMEQIGTPPVLIIHTDERYGVTRTEMNQIQNFIYCFE